MSKDRTTYSIRVENVIYDTADSTVEMEYDAVRDYVRVNVESNFMDMAKSVKKWVDWSSYGMCTLDIISLDILRELADAMKDMEWLYESSDEDEDDYDEDAEMSVVGEDVKQAVLKRLYNAGADFADFIAERLKEGGFEDITNSEGWTNLLCFKNRINNAFHIEIPFMLLLDLPNIDSRILIKAPEPERYCEGNGRFGYHRSLDKYLITLRRG